VCDVVFLDFFVDRHFVYCLCTKEQLILVGIIFIFNSSCTIISSESMEI